MKIFRLNRLDLYYAPLPGKCPVSRRKFQLASRQFWKNIGVEIGRESDETRACVSWTHRVPRRRPGAWRRLWPGRRDRSPRRSRRVRRLGGH